MVTIPEVLLFLFLANILTQDCKHIVSLVKIDAKIYSIFIGTHSSIRQNKCFDGGKLLYNSYTALPL